MRVRFDQEADALYIRLDKSSVIESEEIPPRSHARSGRTGRDHRDRDVRGERAPPWR